VGFSLVVGFNDLFFMSLMFLVSGMFVWHGLSRKGPGHFLAGRLLRLGIPFCVAAAVIAPVAYFATYVQASHSFSFAGFWSQWIALGQWPSGPAWFLWVLLCFDALAAAGMLASPRWGAYLGDLIARTTKRPAVFFLTLSALSAAVYLPMELAFNGFSWSQFGPFAFQTSRVLHYALYFVIGIGIGAAAGSPLWQPRGRLARRWIVWSAVALLVFLAAIAATIAAITPKTASRSTEIIADLTFSLSCAASSLAFTAIFSRFAQRSNPIWDSLSRNAYGIYLLHYPFVSWLQYALLRSRLSGFEKGVLVTVLATLLCWAATAALRRIPAVARVV
jgi:peptidoglycan/LPS O-acetylase OafA/YrhL